MHTQVFVTMILSNAILRGYSFTINRKERQNGMPSSIGETEILTQNHHNRRITNNIKLEYTEYFFKTSDLEIIPVKCYTKIERISNVTSSTMCRPLESHQEICLECHYRSYDRKFIRYQDDVGKYVKMAIPPSGFVCMPREIAAGCDVEKIGRFVEMDVVW